MRRMEHVLALPTALDAPQPVPPVPSQSSVEHHLTTFPDRISQLMHNSMVRYSANAPFDIQPDANVATSTTAVAAATERARTGLALAMDLIRLQPNVDDATAATHLRPLNFGTPSSPPRISSTPGSYNRQHGHSVAISASVSGYNVSPNGFGGTDMEQNVAPIRSELSIDTAMPPKKLTSNDIPVLDSFPGYYGFDLYRPLCGDAYEASETKPSTAFFYFKDEQGWTNLYSKKTPTWWNLSYCCQRQPPEGSFLRLIPVYGTSDKQQEVIQRCFEDFMSMPCNSMARYSIVLVGNSLADYFFDPLTERLCVTLPYEKPKEGCDYSQFNGKFMCFNSCLYNGGQGNKKPLFLIITLERLVSGSEVSKGQCEVLGRQCIKFRSCACPKRDKENSERRTIDPASYSIQAFGKRRKETERHEKHGKKVRSHNSKFPTRGRQASGRWSSPTGGQHDQVDMRSNSADDAFESIRFGEYFSDHNVGAVVNYNGDTYHLMLVPTDLPGGLETLSGVRFSLIRNWLYTPDPATRPGLLKVAALKPELDVDTQRAIKTDGSDDMYRSSRVSCFTSADQTVQQLLSMETQLAETFTEIAHMGNPTRPYPFSTDSTDSQPNSAVALPMGLNSIDDSINLAHEYPPTCGVGPLSSDSGISTDPIQLRNPSLGILQQQQQQNQHAFPRSSTFQSSIIPNASGSYNFDYTSVFHSSNTQSYPSSHRLNQSATSMPYPLTVLGEAYANTPVTTTDVSESAPRSTGKNTGRRRSTTGVPEADPTTPMISLSLNQAIANPSLYPANYLSGRSSGSDPTPSSILFETFPRTSLTVSQPTGVVGAANQLYFYQTMNSAPMTENLVLPEGVLNSYAEREKNYDEHILTSQLDIMRQQNSI